MGMLLLKRDTGGYLECLGTATSTKLCWGYRSTAGGGSIVPRSPLTLSTITYCVQKYLQNVCRAETLFRISDRSHWRCVAREWVGGSWAGEETGDFQQLPRVEEDPGPRQEASRQSWLVAILNFLTSPFPFEHHCPTEIREITHCYNFLGRWVCLSQPDSLPHSKTAHWDRG